jgi:DNA repair protein RecN (Recombination protein N)
MLREISIRDLGVICAAHLSLGPGLTALTGETGAGKTMLVASVRLLLGQRADAKLVRSGAPRAVVAARLDIDPGDPLIADLVDQGAELDGDEVVIVRSVGADGRSRATIGGLPVPVATLGALVAATVRLHGQADQLTLGQAETIRNFVDAESGADGESALAAYRTAHAQRAAAAAALDALLTDAADADRLADELRDGLAAVDRVRPAPGERTDLEAEVARLGAVDQLLAAAAGAARLLDGSDDQPAVADLVADAGAQLAHAGDVDPALGELGARTLAVAADLREIGRDVSRYVDDLGDAPERLGVAADRLAVLTRLDRRFGDEPDAALEWAAGARDRLEALGDLTAAITAATERVDAASMELRACAASLTAVRQSTAIRLSDAITAELDRLALAGARLTIDVSERPGDIADLPAHGADDVTILFAAHPGSALRPIAKSASGGELSRVMLALEVVARTGAPCPTFVFDEVDAGVGGAAAGQVGRRLADVAWAGAGADEPTSQVLVVTHLPQVAAYADTHVSVVRDDSGDLPVTNVVVLDDEGRVAELSRMLAGRDDLASGREHATELIGAVRAERQQASAPARARRR